MRTKSLLVLFLVTTFAIVSCHKGDKTGLHIPKDAAVVVHINSAALTSKLSWEEISATDWFKHHAQEEKDSLGQQLMKDPGNSGIDTKADLVFFLKKQGHGGYFVFEGSIKDAGKFEAFIKQVSTNAEASTDGDIHYIANKGENLTAWTGSSFVFIGNSPLPDMSAAMMGRNSMPSRFPIDSLKQFAKHTLTMSSDEYLDNDSRFASLVKDGSDVHFWLNGGSLYGNSMGGILSMMKFNLLLEDNIAAASVNFDNGKITLNGKQYYGKEMAKLMADYPVKPVSADVLNRIPSQNVVGAVAFNFPPEGFREFLKMTGLDGLANGFLGQMNFSVDDFIKANKGSVVLAVSDFAVKADEVIPESMEDRAPGKHFSHEPSANVLFATAVNDKPSFEKLIGVVTQATKEMSSEKMASIHTKLGNDWFAAGNSAEQVDQFIAGTTTKNPIADKISGHPFGLYVDLQKLVTAAKSAEPDSSDLAAMTLMTNTWQDITATGGEYKDKAMEFHAEVNLMDKNTNSLKQLNEFSDDIYKIHDEKRKRRMEELTIDVPADSLKAPARDK